MFQCINQYQWGKACYKVLERVSAHPVTQPEDYCIKVLEDFGQKIQPDNYPEIL